MIDPNIEVNVGGTIKGKIAIDSSGSGTELSTIFKFPRSGLL